MANHTQDSGFGISPEEAKSAFEHPDPRGSSFYGKRSLEADFYYDTQNEVWVYKWADSRLILTAKSVHEYQEARRVR